MPNYVAGVGPFEPRLMIIGEAPGSKENEQGVPFVGPTGAMLDEMLFNAGINRNDCYLTNVVKYQPPFNDFTKLHLIDVDLATSIRELWEHEIHVFRPNCILAVGDEALNALTGLSGILNYRGSILRGTDGVQKVVATIHPAALFPRKGAENKCLPYVYRKLIQSDINRAVEESATRDIKLPERNITIARNSLDLFRFFREYEKANRPAVDIESVNCVPVSIAFAFNRFHSVTCPLLKNIGGLSLTDMPLRDLAEAWKIIAKALFEFDLVGQNFKYDEYKLSLVRLICRKLVSDTLLKTHTIFPELPTKSLATQASLWTRQPFYKDDGKENKIGTKFDVDKFFIYNGTDSCVTKEIDEEQEDDLRGLGEKFGVPLYNLYYNEYMRKHKFYLKMENNGFRVDHDKQEYLKKVYTELQNNAHMHLVDKIGHDVNTKSYPQMYRLLYEEMRFPKRVKDPTSEDAIIALLGNHCKGKDATLKKEILEGILEERRIRDQKSRYINFCPDYDDRCKSSFKITGTETARTSTNILKKPIRPKKIGLAFHTISKHGRLAKDIRSMFIPDAGKVFIQGDLSQAEARIVAVLAEDYRLLEAFDKVDIHRRTAGLFFGFSTFLNLNQVVLPVIDSLEKDGPERFTGKMFRHAGNYDMGKRRAMNEFNVNAQKYEINMSISEWKAGEFIRLFHDASPNIRGVFHKSIRDAIDSTRALVNVYGRPRVFNGNWEDDLYKEAYAFIPQSTVADLNQGAALDCDDEFNGDVEVMFLSENHDSLLIQAPANDWERYASVLKRHQTRMLDFSLYCTLKRDYKLTIPVDIEMSDQNYAALKKVKVA